jgi:hypothetical protein
MFDIAKRINEYDKDHCWQYDIRLNNVKSDIKEAKVEGLTKKELSKLKVTDFDIQFEEKENIMQEVKTFIEKHEWLGKIGLYPTHFFTARYKGVLAGVVIMDMPNAFSKLLGDNTKKMERLISRGACVSWSPKNLASSLIMYAIKWMVQNTDYRMFSAYSDPEAKELGTIYQACNFYYIGQKSGATHQYKSDTGRWVSDRYFRSRSVYKKLARENGIDFKKEWQDGDKVKFDLMPVRIAKKIKTLSKEYMTSCEKRKVKRKHKYIYVLGRDKRETKKLRELFLSRNKIYDYPKNRGE